MACYRAEFKCTPTLSYTLVAPQKEPLVAQGVVYRPIRKAPSRWLSPVWWLLPQSLMGLLIQYFQDLEEGQDGVRGERMRPQGFRRPPSDWAQGVCACCGIRGAPQNEAFSRNCAAVHTTWLWSPRSVSVTNPNLNTFRT